MMYYDTDSIKVTGPTAEEKIRMKLFLNSFYGKMISCTHFSDGKEQNMNKDYIVIPEMGISEDTTNKTGIIFKSKIAGILKGDDGNGIIILDSNYHLYCKDSYADIVKQLV